MNLKQEVKAQKVLHSSAGAAEVMMGGKGMCLGENLAASLCSFFWLSGILRLLPREDGNRKQCLETQRLVGDVETLCSVPNTEISFSEAFETQIYKLHL